MRAVTRMVVRLATLASAQATRPTERMRRNSAVRSGARSVGRKPAPPRSTTAPWPRVAAVMVSAKARPAPASPMPAGSAKAQASGG